MSENIRVLNAGPNVLQIDRAGHLIAGGEIADVSPEDPETARHLAAGRLVEVQEPVRAPAAKTTKTSESGETK
jgi:hypothetical protein